RVHLRSDTVRGERGEGQPGARFLRDASRESFAPRLPADDPHPPRRHEPRAYARARDGVRDRRPGADALGSDHVHALWTHLDEDIAVERRARTRVGLVDDPLASIDRDPVAHEVAEERLAR